MQVRNIPKKLIIKPNEKCLILAPHPDDETLGCGGLLLKYSKHCKVVVCTDGSKYKRGDSDEIKNLRLKEFQSAMGFANIKDYENLMIEDKELAQNLDRLNSLNLKSYDYVFVPNEYENHIDHKCILKKVEALLKFHHKTKIICYEVWSAISNPDLYLDISDLAKKKQEMIFLYKSQQARNNYANKIIALNNYRGLVVKKDYAEAYLMVETPSQKFSSLFDYQKNKNGIYIKFFGIKIKHKLNS